MSIEFQSPPLNLTNWNNLPSRIQPTAAEKGTTQSTAAALALRAARRTPMGGGP
jgi:hypothetical protein